MDKKSKAVCSAIYDIDINVTDPKDVKPNPVQVAEPAKELEGTLFNPILTNEDIMEKEDTQQSSRSEHMHSWVCNTPLSLFSFTHRNCQLSFMLY
jgi:hypothetical protein